MRLKVNKKYLKQKDLIQETSGVSKNDWGQGNGHLQQRQGRVSDDDEEKRENNHSSLVSSFDKVGRFVR